MAGVAIATRHKLRKCVAHKSLTLYTAMGMITEEEVVSFESANSRGTFRR